MIDIHMLVHQIPIQNSNECNYYLTNTFMKEAVHNIILAVINKSKYTLTAKL